MPEPPAPPELLLPEEPLLPPMLPDEPLLPPMPPDEPLLPPMPPDEPLLPLPMLPEEPLLPPMPPELPEPDESGIVAPDEPGMLEDPEAPLLPLLPPLESGLVLELPELPDDPLPLP